MTMLTEGWIGSRYSPMVLDINYIDLKNQVIKAERKLLNALGFVVHVNHPHKLIYTYLHALGATENHELMQKAWSYMNDGLRTDIFLRYRPETIACACIHLAARTITEPVPLPREPFLWFEAFDASDKDVQTISYLLLQVYSRIRAPNWTRLNDTLNKIRIKFNSAFAKSQQGEKVANKEVERAKAVLEKRRREIVSKACEIEKRQNGATKINSKEGHTKEMDSKRDRGKENDHCSAKQSSSSTSRSRSRSRSRSPVEPRKFRSSPARRRAESSERDRHSRRNHHHSRHQRDERRRIREERRAEKERHHRNRTRSRDRRRIDRVSNQREREKDVYLALGKRRKSSESPPSVKMRR
ncbi:unnamed protein product [Thelazia callipaeda]|uniref:CYCLIN domain-containing protein n=1 Tax=Thelazia callipaeda TaxID=103827 RepID=A0A0N5D7L4_THECL|nr:unnamed protein product [Thelazia callipaeda]